VAREYILAEHRGYDRAQVGDGWSEYAEHLATRESVIKTTNVSVLSSKLLLLLMSWFLM
jgi:glutathione S-transferase